MASTPRKKPKAGARRKPAKAARATAAEAAPVVSLPPKRGQGRPSKYDPAICDLVLDLGEAGKSRTQIASTLRISRQTLLNWENAHPEFMDAMSMASQFAQAWWEDQGQTNLTNKAFNGHVYSFQMKNRFRADYTDSLQVQHDASATFVQILKQISGGGPSAAQPETSR